MAKPDDKVRLLIPLKARKKNRRPKIPLPAHKPPSAHLALGSHILRTIGRAWRGRRRMEAGEFAKITECSETEDLAERQSAANAGWPIWLLKFGSDLPSGMKCRQ